MHTYMYAYLYVCIRICMHTYIYTRDQNMLIRTDMHIYTRIHKSTDLAAGHCAITTAPCNLSFAPRCFFVIPAKIPAKIGSEW